MCASPSLTNCNDHALPIFDGAIFASLKPIQKTGNPFSCAKLPASAHVFVFQILNVEGAKLVVNYGLNKARFPAPVPSGSRVRMGAEIGAVETVAGGLQVTLNATFDIEDAPKPACVAEILFRYYE